mgnify:CR=1 FL=1
MSKEITTISPEGLEIANCYLQYGNIRAVCDYMNVAENKVVDILNKRDVKRYIDTVYLDMGYRNKNNTKASEKIKSLINGSSLNAVASRVVKEEAAKSNSGIITTEEEIKAYNVIKTILAMSSKFKNSDLDRIGFRDLKGFFLILFEDNQKKRICSLIFKENSKVIEIDNERFPINEVSVASITKLKKQLLDSALKYV